MLKYWQHNIGLCCLCWRHIICMPHVLARSISVKHLDNTLHLQDCHRRNTKISSTAGHEYVQESTLFLPGVRQASHCCSPSRVVVSLSIPCCPTQKGHETEHSQLTYEKMMLRTATPQAPLSSSPGTLAEWGRAWFAPTLRTEGGD